METRPQGSQDQSSWKLEEVLNTHSLRSWVNYVYNVDGRNPYRVFRCCLRNQYWTESENSQMDRESR